MKFNILFLLLFLGTQDHLSSQSNPFLKTSSEKSIAEGRPSSPLSSLKDSGPPPGILEGIAKIQRQLNQELTSFIKSAAQGVPGALTILLLIAIGYGFLHSLLPGHQKLTVSAYFLSQKATYFQAFIAAGLFTFFNSLFSIILLIVFHFIFEFGAGATIDQAARWGQGLSALGLVILGTFLLALKLKEWKDLRRKKALSQIQKLMGLPPGQIFDEVLPTLSWGRFIGFLALAALLPCPGALLILLFSLSLGQFTLGILTVTAVAFGMGVLLWILGTLVLFLKNRGNRWLGPGGRPGVYWALEVSSLVLLTSVGLLFLPGII